jgi:hypothetical protein
MISIFLTKKRTIKDNILSVEATQARKKINTNLRTVRIEIKEM